MEGNYGLCGTLEMMSNLLLLIDLDLSLPLIQGKKDAITETYLSCLEERFLEIPFKRFNTLTKEKLEAPYSLKDYPSIIIKGANKDFVVVIWDRGLFEGGIWTAR